MPRVVVCTVLFLFVVVEAVAAASSVSRFRLPSGNARPFRIESGKANDLWFSEDRTGALARVTTTGKITEYKLPTLKRPGVVEVAPSGAVWTARNNRLARLVLKKTRKSNGRIIESPRYTEFTVPTQNLRIESVAAKRDGTVWFTGYVNGEGRSYFGRISPAGQIAEFSAGADVKQLSASLVVTPDQTLVLTTQDAVLEIGGDGSVRRRLALPTGPVPTWAGEPLATSDGSVWLIQTLLYPVPGYSAPEYRYRFVRLTKDRTLRALPELPVAQSGWAGLLFLGPDGRPWVSGTDRLNRGVVGRVTPEGAIYQPLSFAVRGWAVDLATGADGNLWFTERLQSNAIARFVLGRVPGRAQQR